MCVGMFFSGVCLFVSPCVSACLCVRVSRSDVNPKSGETDFGVPRVVKRVKNTVFTTFYKKTPIFFTIFFKSFFYNLFCNLFLYRTHHLQDLPVSCSKHVILSCVCMYTIPETQETFSEKVGCNDASLT